MSPKDSAFPAGNEGYVESKSEYQQIRTRFSLRMLACLPGYDSVDPMKVNPEFFRLGIVDLKPSPRPSWDEMGMRTAQLWSERSSDPKVRVGACVLDHYHRVIGIGYNGRAAGEPNERESLEQGMSGFIHAEINALLATNWSDGAATLYVTHEPCASCARAIINTRRIRRVVYGQSYNETARTFARLPSGAEIMRAAGLTVERHE